MSVTESFKFGIEKIFDTRFLILGLIFSFPFVIFNILSSLSNILFPSSFTFISLLVIISTILYSPIPQLSFIFLAKNEIKRKKKINFKELLKIWKKYYVRILAINIILGIIVGLMFLPSILIALLPIQNLEFLPIQLSIFFISLIVSLIIAIYVAMRLVLSTYIAIIEDSEIIKSIKTSWKISKGNVLKLFLISFIFSILLLLILSFVSLVNAYIFKNFAISILILYLATTASIIYYPFAYTYFYLKFLKRRK